MDPQEQAIKAAQVLPGNVGGLNERGKIVRGDVSDADMLEILQAQLLDPERSPVFDDSLKAEISRIEKRVGQAYSGQPVQKPVDPAAPKELGPLRTHTEAMQQVLSPVGVIPPERKPDSPSFQQLMSAGFKAANEIGSAGQALAALLERKEAQAKARFYGEESPDFKPREHIQGYEIHAPRFDDARSIREVDALKQQIDRENAVNQTIGEGGFAGLAAVFLNGAMSPVNIIPGSQVVKSFRLGEDLVRSAARSGAALGAAGALSEAALQGTQVTRTGEESAIAIGTSIFLGGVLGGASRLFAGSLPKLGSQVAKELRVPPPHKPDPLTEPNSIEVPTTGTAGAMRVQDMEFKLKSALGIEHIVKFISPGLELATSVARKAREVAARLIEQPYYTTDMAKGLPAPRSAESNIRAWQAPLAQSLDELDNQFSLYKKGGGNLSRKEFYEQVGPAMRRNDQHQIPEVAASAKAFRNILFNALRDAAVNVKLLAEELKVIGADSYLTRVYNIEKILARRPEFEERLTRWLADEELSKAKNKAAGPVQPGELTDINDLRLVAEEITDHILGISDGRIPYEAIPLKRGPLRERVLTIRDEAIEDFLENDISTIARFYTRTMAPDVEIKRAFGSVDLKDEISEIGVDYKKLIAEAKTEKQRLKLGKKWQRDVKLVKAMRDRLRGTYGAPADPNSLGVRASTTIRNWTYLAQMGEMVLASIPDLMRSTMVYGMMNTLRDGILPMIRSFKDFRMAAREAKVAGEALDMVLNSRAMDLADIGDQYGRHSKFERGVQAATDRFGNWTLMNQWNTALKQFTGVIGQHYILRAALKGSARSARDIEQLAFRGISPEVADRIAAQFKRWGEESNGVMIANTKQWEIKDALDDEALRAFRTAVAKDIRRTIVTPGAGDRMLWTSSVQGQLIGQFRSFAFAATQRVLVSGLQQRDMAVLNGAILSVVLGMGVYALRTKISGRELSDDPATWIKEGVDRSGITGWLWEAGNITEKFTGGTIGPSALFGGAPSSRYVDRGALGAIFGPNVGVVENVAKAGGAIATGEFSKSDVRSLRRLIPYQNLWYLRSLFDQMQKGVEEEFGITNERR